MNNPRNCPGPGDEVTWPAYAGHPNDPRDDYPEWEDMTDEQRRAELASWSRSELIAELLRMSRE